MTIGVCSLIGSAGSSAGGVLGLDNVSESEVSCVGGCRNWVEWALPCDGCKWAASRRCKIDPVGSIASTQS